MTSKIIEELYSLSATSIEKYLLINGWNRDYSFKNRKIMVFRNAIDKEMTIAFPASEKFIDFYPKVNSILETLAFYNEKTVQQIINEIKISYFDRLEFRVKSDISEDGKLPLGYATNCIEGLKDLILYAACAEQDAQPLCLRATSYAKNIVNKFKLAQTSVGSFVINIDIKVVDDKNEQLQLEGIEEVDIPEEHKIVKRIYTGLNQINRIVKEETDLNVMVSDAYKTGITANMCDALLKLKPDRDNVEIDTTFRYASAIVHKAGEVDKVSIRNNHFYVIDEISKMYHNKEDIQDAYIRGVIRTLETANRKGHREKEIKILMIYEGKYRTVVVELTDNDHKLACDAYRDEKEVEAYGELDMSSKFWRLRNYRKFKVINDD